MTDNNKNNHKEYNGKPINGNAVKCSQARKDLDYKTKALLACVDVGKLLTGARNLEEILSLIVDKASQLFEAQTWSLLLVDEETDELVFKIAMGADSSDLVGIRLPPGEGVVGNVAKTGQPMFMSDVSKESVFFSNIDKQTGFTTESIVCVPLKSRGKVLGVLELINIRNVDNFLTGRLDILTILADYAAIAIENSQYVEKIHHMSITDEYTGLYNARYLHKILDKKIEQAGKQNTEIAVVFMDIDDFKNIVDTYGHLSGSRILKEIGQTISACLDTNDILIKYGGDEYIIILTDKKKQDVKNLVETILHKIRESVYLNSESPPAKVTASFGVAMFPEDAESKKDLLLLADKCMYSVKNTEKNGVGMINRE